MEASFEWTDIPEIAKLQRGSHNKESKLQTDVQRMENVASILTKIYFYILYLQRYIITF